MSVKSPSPGQSDLVDLLQGATYATILATLIVVLSPLELELLAVVTVAGLIYDVASAMVGDK